MDPPKSWTIPLLIVVGGSSHTAVPSLTGGNKTDTDQATLSYSPHGLTSGRCDVPENPYYRSALLKDDAPRKRSGDGAANVSSVPPRLDGTVSGGDASVGTRRVEATDLVGVGGSDEKGNESHPENLSAVLVAGSHCTSPAASTSSALPTPHPLHRKPLYSSVSVDAPSAITPLGIRGSYQVRLGPLSVVVRPGFTLESDDYRYPLQCYRYRHKDGSLLTLMAEECSAMGQPVFIDEYVFRSIDATRAAAERSKAFFKVKLNVDAREVVTTVMEKYVNLHIGPVPIVVASFFAVCGSLALTIQLQAHMAQYHDHMPDLFATVQTARLDASAARQLAMVSRGGQCTYALEGGGDAFGFLLTAPTSVLVRAVECQMAPSDAPVDSITVARVVHRGTPRWEAHIVVRPRSKWRLVHWLRQVEATLAESHSEPSSSSDPYELPLVPEMVSLVLLPDSVTDLVEVTAMIEALRASGSLFISVPSVPPLVISQEAIRWVPPHDDANGDDAAAVAAADDWLAPSVGFPRYVSRYWSLPLPSLQHFETIVCEHAGDNSVTLFLTPTQGTPSGICEMEPLLLHCEHGGVRDGGDVCVNRLVHQSSVLFLHQVDPHISRNEAGEVCVIMEGLSCTRPQCVMRLAAVHVRVSKAEEGQQGAAGGGASLGASENNEDNGGYWIVFRWAFDESSEVSRELRRYEDTLLQSGRPR